MGKRKACDIDTYKNRICNSILNEKLTYFRKGLNKLDLHDLKKLLKCNYQSIPTKKKDMLDILCEAMTFGSILPHKDGQILCKNNRYYLINHKNKCVPYPFKIRLIKRICFLIPEDLKLKYEFLKFYNFKTRFSVPKILEPLPAKSTKKKHNTNAKKNKKLKVKNKSTEEKHTREITNNIKLKEEIENLKNKIEKKRKTIALLDLENELLSKKRLFEEEQFKLEIKRLKRQLSLFF